MAVVSAAGSTVTAMWSSWWGRWCRDPADCERIVGPSPPWKALGLHPGVCVEVGVPRESLTSADPRTRRPRGGSPWENPGHGTGATSDQEAQSGWVFVELDTRQDAGYRI